MDLSGRFQQQSVSLRQERTHHQPAHARSCGTCHLHAFRDYFTVEPEGRKLRHLE
jgi:hypothetical protein